MALQKPIASMIPAFDADFDHTISFVVNGGDQVVGNRAVIKLGSTNETVYDETQTTFALQHNIPAQTLANGRYYTIQIQTFNSEGGASAFSSPITFYCYNQPEFAFTNLPSGNVIINAGYNFELSYDQAEGEALNSWVVNLYNASQTLIWTSDTNYAGASGLPPTKFGVDISGFEDGSLYYIRAIGQTEQFTVLDTGYILLTAAFNTSSIYTQFVLSNKNCEGYIIITSNVVSLDGTSNPDPPIYINDAEIDLRGKEDYVNWEQSFGIYDKSTVRIWLRSMNKDSIIATFYNADAPDQSMTLCEREYTENGVTYIYIEGYYVGLIGIEGYIYSNIIQKPGDEQQLMIWLQKNGGMYDISIAEVTG